MSVNKIMLMGRLTKDPEMKTTQSGIASCRFDIAVDRYSKDDKKTDFFQITAWRQQAEFVCKYFTKGCMIFVEGNLQNNNYTDNNGVKHYTNQINADKVSFCGDKAGGVEGTPQYNPAQQSVQNAVQAAQASKPSPELGDLGDFEEIDDGSVPF